jgi:radical SAM superfamily enzyme YgiQ (UPF0313 family)
VSPYEEIHSYGVRSLSSYLKARGVRVSIIFCPLQSRFDAYLFQQKRRILPRRIIDEIARISADATCIGISLMTDYFNAAVVLTKELKKRLPHLPILWGGIHPTILPEQCTNYADFVCIGEGYESTYELLQHIKRGDKFPRVAGICYRKDEKFIAADLRLPISNIDLLPFLDYALEGHYIRHGNAIVPLTVSLLKRYLGFWYTSFFTYGCPLNCSYCCNSFLHRLNPGYRQVYKHSPEYIIEEIKSVRKLHPFIKMVKFNDDNFMSLTEEEMESFAILQRKFERTPFVVTGINPLFITEQKIDILVKAGLRRARIGIQAGSEKILREVYNRQIGNEDIVRSSKILSRYAKKLVPTAYDIILDNPWEKTEDLVDTFELICRLSRPFVLNIFSLKFYPRTAIWERAVKEGIINSVGDTAVYPKNYFTWQNNYLNCLIAIRGLIEIPPFLQKHLFDKQRIAENRPVSLLYRNFINSLMLLKKAYVQVSRRDVTMLPYFIARMLI